MVFRNDESADLKEERCFRSGRSLTFSCLRFAGRRLNMRHPLSKIVFDLILRTQCGQVSA